MLNRFNPHVCETFFADEVVLVEGDTEAIVVRQLLHEHYPEKDIFVLNTGTKNNMPFFIKILSHFKIKQHVIHDSDCRYQYDKDRNVVLKKDLTPKANSAWTLNQTIWDEMDRSNIIHPNIVKRYVSVQNFEDSHNYVYDVKKGKPLSAWEFAQKLDIAGNDSIISFIKQIVGIEHNGIEFTQKDLENLVIESYREPLKLTMLKSDDKTITFSLSLNRLDVGLCEFTEKNINITIKKQKYDTPGFKKILERHLTKSISKNDAYKSFKNSEFTYLTYSK